MLARNIVKSISHVSRLSPSMLKGFLYVPQQATAHRRHAHQEDMDFSLSTWQCPRVLHPGARASVAQRAPPHQLHRPPAGLCL